MPSRRLLPPREDGMNRASLGSARDTRAKWQLPELEGGPEMTIVAGFDVHRRQITFDALDTDTGELIRGRIDATPSAVECWAARFKGRGVHVALEDRKSTRLNSSHMSISYAVFCLKKKKKKKKMTE